MRASTSHLAMLKSSSAFSPVAVEVNSFSKCYCPHPQETRVRMSSVLLGNLLKAAKLDLKIFFCLFVLGGVV